MAETCEADSQRELGEIAATLRHILDRISGIEAKQAELERELHGRLANQAKRLEGIETEHKVEDVRHKLRSRLHGAWLGVGGMTVGALFLRVWQWLTHGGNP